MRRRDFIAALLKDFLERADAVVSIVAVVNVSALYQAGNTCIVFLRKLHLHSEHEGAAKVLSLREHVDKATIHLDDFMANAETHPIAVLYLPLTHFFLRDSISLQPSKQLEQLLNIFLSNTLSLVCNMDDQHL